MNDLAGIIKKRAVPGILLFDQDCRLLYSNREALDMLPTIDTHDREDGAVPSEIYRICRQLKETSEAAERHLDYSVYKTGDVYCSLRGFVLEAGVGTSNPPRIMILMERVVVSHEVDIGKVCQEFQLTKRETEVVALLYRGMGNKEISKRMFISEHTVKDHMKNIMRKMSVCSRTEMMAILK